jgi:hypothetical protein
MDIKEQFDEPQTNITDKIYQLPTPNAFSVSNLKLPSDWKVTLWNYDDDLCDAYSWEKVGLKCPDSHLLPPVENGKLRNFTTADGVSYRLYLKRQVDGSWMWYWYYNSDRKPYLVGGYNPEVAQDEESKRRESLRDNYVIQPPRIKGQTADSTYFLPNTKSTVIIYVDNTSTSPIEVSNIYFGDLNEEFVSNIKLPDKPIPVGEWGEISFDYKPENDSPTPFDTSLEMVVRIKIGSNTFSDYKIVYNHSVGSSVQVLEACSKKFSQTEFDKAKNWWKNWLNNPITKTKFEKNWNYTKTKVEDIFEDYLEALVTARLVYTFSDKPNQGWVSGKGTFLQFYGITTDGIDYPVYVNCSVNYYDTYSLFLHELQHILNRRHEIHPYEDDIFQGQSKTLKKEFEGDLSKRAEEAKEVLLQNGFDEYQVLDLSNNFDWMIKNDIEHLEKSNEILSTFFEVRANLNFSPGQNITKEDLIKNSRIDSVESFICQWLYSRENLQNWLNLFNKSARKKQATQTDVAV